MRTNKLCGVASLLLLVSACGVKPPDATTEPPAGSNSKGLPEGNPVVKQQGTSLSLPTVQPRLVEFRTTQGDRVQVAAEHDPWADAVVSFRQGNPAPIRSKDPRGAVGKPDYKGKDDAADEQSYVALGHGGELILEFIDNVLIDGPGDDLVIFEIGPSVEPTHVAISKDGQHWINVGQTRGGKSTLDIAPFVKPGQRFRFVKVTDAKAGLSNDTEWAGADIDAVGALNSLVVAPRASATRSLLVFDRSRQNIELFDPTNKSLGNWEARNNVIQGTQRFPDGAHPFVRSEPHRDSADPDSPFGSHGVFVFDIGDKGNRGLGIHSGRANAKPSPGPSHATEGSIRTTDAAMQAIVAQHSRKPIGLVIVK